MAKSDPESSRWMDDGAVFPSLPVALWLTKHARRRLISHDTACISRCSLN